MFSADPAANCAEEWWVDEMVTVRRREASQVVRSVHFAVSEIVYYAMMPVVS